MSKLTKVLVLLIAAIALIASMIALTHLEAPQFQVGFLNGALMIVIGVMCGLLMARESQ
jgi:hypothetical protein